MLALALVCGFKSVEFHKTLPVADAFALVLTSGLFGPQSSIHSDVTSPWRRKDPLLPRYKNRHPE